MHKKIINLSEKRIKHFLENIEKYSFFYKGSETYIEEIKGEFKEMLDELKENNSVYLEDELGDLFWDYLCLLQSLKFEGKITSVQKVFERCYKKFSGRISEETGKNNGEWKEIKKAQKSELLLEHKKLYNE